MKGIRKNCNSGFDKGINIPHYIIKNPNFCTKLPIFQKRYIIDMVFIPIRNLKDAADSRIKNGRHAGGLWGVKNPEKQLPNLQKRMGQLITDIILYDIPHTFLKFPKLVKNPEYTYKKLMPFINGIQIDEFKSIFTELASKTKSDYWVLKQLAEDN